MFFKKSLKTANSHCRSLVLRIVICDENVNRVQLKKSLSTRDDTDKISNLFVKKKLSLFAILVENH